jgi:hypothetical protein
MIPEHAFRWYTEYAPSTVVYLWSPLYPTYRNGKWNVCYALTQDGEIIFEGDDLYPSPMVQDHLSVECIMHLLSFLTLRPGDTDAEYFDEYTQAQLDWIESDACEELGLWVYDYENEEE